MSTKSIVAKTTIVVCHVQEYSVTSCAGLGCLTYIYIITQILVRFNFSAQV